MWNVAINVWNVAVEVWNIVIKTGILPSSLKHSQKVLELLKNHRCLSVSIRIYLWLNSLSRFIIQLFKSYDKTNFILGRGRFD